MARESRETTLLNRSLGGSYGSPRGGEFTLN